ncbi:glycosyltransferase family 8 protein [Calocera cornea HHB12733]|uniref:Glycosyltransferase family 8 protein n=1 Tax=Calocera cornea HHB12733 TaxID=1353952 RepID=A0A165J6Y2_9BASI|nr:glycosyltransferase family 8 protein [Calocera cornea HHB12733]
MLSSLPLPRMQATRLLTLFAFGFLLLLTSLLSSSLLSPTPDSDDGYYTYATSSLSAAKSAASRFFHSAASAGSRVTLFTWAGGNTEYELEPLEEYAELGAGAYPVGAKPWLPEVEGGVPGEWTILEEERERVKASAKGNGMGVGNGGLVDWDFPAPQMDMPMLVVQEYGPPTVEFALVIMGESAAVEAVTMLKGILMHISTPVALHIVCDEDAMYYIDERITLVTRPSYDISVSYNLLTPDQIWARGARAGIGSTYHAGPGGLAKVFLHEILTETKRAIFIDIDTLFTVDPLLLWKEFARFRPGQVFAVPTLGPESDELTVCSCALLLDLEAMRERFQWVASDLRPGASRTDVAYSSLMSTGLDPRNPPFGDQGVYYAIWKARPELAGHLSLSWDVSHCRNHWGFSMADGDDEMTEEEQERRRDERMQSVEARMRNAPEKYPIFPGILHFNCIDNEANSFTYADIVDFPDWGPLVQTATQYKWTWLNRGDGSAKVDRVMFEDVRFADERWPEVERVGGWTPAAPAGAVRMPTYEAEGGWETDVAFAFEQEGGAVHLEGSSNDSEMLDFVLGEDGEWHQAGEYAEGPVTGKWTEVETTYDDEPLAYDDLPATENDWAEGELPYDEPPAYDTPLEYAEPAPPGQGDWMDEPSAATAAAALPYEDEEGAFDLPPADFEPELGEDLDLDLDLDVQDQELPEEGKWVLGLDGEWEWAEDPAAIEGEEAELPEEVGESWGPHAPVPAHVDAAIPAVPAAHAEPGTAVTAEDIQRQQLKEKLAAALAGHTKAPAAAQPAAPDLSAEPVEELDELPPLRMASPDALAEADTEPAFEDDLIPLFPEDVDLPVEEAPEEMGEWVEDENGEWVWVPVA